MLHEKFIAILIVFSLSESTIVFLKYFLSDLLIKILITAKFSKAEVRNLSYLVHLGAAGSFLENGGSDYNLKVSYYL